MKTINALAICGSLRKDSYNRKLLKIAKSIARELGAEVEEADLKDLKLPIYDGDIEAQGFPEAVQKLQAAVAKADVLLIATPEYNYSISAALKNALEWLSRGPKPISGKIAAIFGASTGAIGTARAQLHLRQIFVELNVLSPTSPQVLVKLAREAFNDDGAPKDEKTLNLLTNLIQNTFELAIYKGQR